jgi:hypothetical protein
VLVPSNFPSHPGREVPRIPWLTFGANLVTIVDSRRETATARNLLEDRRGAQEMRTSVPQVSVSQILRLEHVLTISYRWRGTALKMN